jgi:ABC-type multidrug transport system ATPase subunit
MNRGISGGERKRVLIALELIAGPSVLIIDEPTSGYDTYILHYIYMYIAYFLYQYLILKSLDAASSVLVMNTIEKLAQATGCIIIVSIHQPRYDIFKKFQQVVVLAPRGIQILADTPTNAVAFFEKATNQKVEFGINPADFILVIYIYIYI